MSNLANLTFELQQEERLHRRRASSNSTLSIISGLLLTAVIFAYMSEVLPPGIAIACAVVCLGILGATHATYRTLERQREELLAQQAALELGESLSEIANLQKEAVGS